MFCRMDGLSTASPVFLHDWWLMRLQGVDGIAVGGIAIKGGEVQSFFKSASIIKRHDSSILEASDGCMVVISGFINRFQTQQNGFPSEFCSHFLNGFPYDWEDYVSQCFREESSEKGRRILSLPVSSQDLSAPGVRDLLMSIHGHDTECVFGRQLSDDLITKLRSIAADSLTKDTAPTIDKVAIEQNPKNQIADLAVADKLDELRKDGCKANVARIQRVCYRREIVASDCASTLVNDGKCSPNKGMPNGKRKKGEIPLRRSSRKVGFNLPSDAREADQKSREGENALEFSLERSSEKRKQVLVGSKVTLSPSLDVTETDGSSRKCEYLRESPLRRSCRERKLESGGCNVNFCTLSCVNKENIETRKGDDLLETPYTIPSRESKQEQVGSKLKYNLSSNACTMEVAANGVNSSIRGILKHHDAKKRGRNSLSITAANNRESRGGNYLFASPLRRSARRMKIVEAGNKNKSNPSSRICSMKVGIMKTASSSCEGTAKDPAGKKILSKGFDVCNDSSRGNKLGACPLRRSSRRRKLDEAGCKDKLGLSADDYSKKGVVNDANCSTETSMKRIGEGRGRTCSSNVEDINREREETKTFERCGAPLRRSSREKKPILRFT